MVGRSAGNDSCRGPPEYKTKRGVGGGVLGPGQRRFLFYHTARHWKVAACPCFTPLTSWQVSQFRVSFVGRTLLNNSFRFIHDFERNKDLLYSILYGVM